MNTTQHVTEVKPLAIPSNVPLKHRSNCPSGVEFYKHLKRCEDFTPIIDNMMTEGVCRSRERAAVLVDAWLQWFSVGATSVTKSFVMLDGPVDRTFHVMILNTTWYFDFCYRNTGVYTHHDPLTEEQRADPQLMDAVDETLDRLQSAFGRDLNPELKLWILRRRRGQLLPSSVSCTGNDGPFDIVPR